MMQRISRVIASSLIILGSVVAGLTEVHAENYAFLVAVQDYDVKDLKRLNYTRNDITEFSVLLRQSGFRDENIVLMTDKPEERRFLAESERIRKQFNLLLGTVTEADTLIVAFSGHGVQFEGDSKNYYCPADADLDDPKRKKLIAVSEIYDLLKDCPAQRKLLLVDACRNDPLSVVKKSRSTVSLKSVTRPQLEVVPKGVVALFSCAAGQESYEWPDLKHGVFFHHILEGWKGKAADADHQVTLNGLVAYATQRTQTFARVNLDAPQSPQLKSDFEGTWVLRQLPRVLKKEIANQIGMKLVLVPPGEFQMGSPPGGDVRELPSHAVHITKPFYIGKFEVTQRQWKSVLRTEPWKGKKFVREGNEFPATYISWEMADTYCKALSRREGQTYRLPTEAEWEYACRGRQPTRFHFGDDPVQLGKYAWFDDNTSALHERYPHEVGRKLPNPFGLYDMHGNVWEWCGDWIDVKFYANSPQADPHGPATGVKHVARGGGWSTRPLGCRSAIRGGDPPTEQNERLGFRIVLIPAKID